MISYGMTHTCPRIFRDKLFLAIYNHMSNKSLDVIPDQKTKYTQRVSPLITEETEKEKMRKKRKKHKAASHNV